MDKSNKEKMTIKILGDEYTVKSQDSTNYLKQVGSYVDGLMQDLAQNYPQLSKQQLAILCSINMADEILKLKEELRRCSYLQQLQLDQEQIGDHESPENTAFDLEQGDGGDDD